MRPLVLFALAAGATTPAAAANLLPNVGGDITCAQGGASCTLANTPSARAHLGAAASGANSDITSLSGLATPLSTGQGGTGVNKIPDLYAPLTCDGNPANATANTTALQAAINTTFLIGGQHRRPQIHLGYGQCYLNAGVLTVSDIEGGTSTTRGELDLEGVKAVSTELTFVGSGDAILIKSGRVRLAGFSLDSDGITRGFTTSTATASTASVASNVMTVNATNAAAVGDIAIYTKSVDATFSFAAVITAATSGSVTFPAIHADASTTGGNLRILHFIGTGRGIAVDPGAAATNHITVSDFVYSDVSVSNQPGDCFYFQNPEQLNLQNITGYGCGGIGLNMDGSDYGSGRRTSIGNVIERARMVNNGSYGFQDYASAGSDHFIVPESLQNYGNAQFRVVGGGNTGPIIDAPDFEAQTIQPASSGIGSNQFGLQMGTLKTTVNGGLIDAGTFATILMQGNGERVNGTALANTGYANTGAYSTASVIQTSAGLTNIKADVTVSGSITKSTPITNTASVLTDPTNAFFEAGVPQGPITFPKLAAAPTNAPGAGLCQFFTVAGTTAGTGKAEVICGTSATPTPLLDNIGAGF